MPYPIPAKSHQDEVELLLSGHKTQDLLIFTKPDSVRNGIAVSAEKKSNQIMTLKVNSQIKTWIWRIVTHLQAVNYNSTSMFMLLAGGSIDKQQCCE